MTDGEKVLYPKILTYNLHDYETVLNHMKTYSANLSKGTMRAVLDALAMTMKSWMPLGHNIKVDGLGIFSLSLEFDAKKPAGKNSHVRIKAINFKPDPELLAEMNKEAEFELAESEVQKPKKPAYSCEERLVLAKDIMDKKGFMTLADYASKTGLSKTYASLELKRLVADSATGITTRGSGSHKVWVKAE